MTFAPMLSGYRPMGEINTTPLIDVMLVLLVMLIITIPMTPDSLPIDLSQHKPGAGPINHLRNKISITQSDRVLWNGATVDGPQLWANLTATRAMPREPELQFEPDADASYDLSVKVLNIIRGSGVTRMGFVGNEKYRQFDR
jgi:biopolymer transport protein ExbD